jgi:uncharacterized protein YgbK (DUF1537 family)
MDVSEIGATAEILSSLPPEWQSTTQDENSKLMPTRHAVPMIIFDDDPTGTQTVHDVPVLTTWDIDILSTILESKEPATFLSANTRALTAEDARQQFDEIMHNLTLAMQYTGVSCDIIIRSDSTLRGHFPLDVERVQFGLHNAGQSQDARVLLVPAFPGGGRYTINGIQWVRQDDQLLPVAQTPYALDATFGFKSSDIRQWVEEKSKKNILAEAVGLLDIDTIRRSGPKGVACFLRQAPAYTVVDAASDADLAVLVQGLALAEDIENRYLVRSAASFVRMRAGITDRPSLTREEIGVKAGAGLLIVGSHVSTTTRQVERLIAETAIATLHVEVRKLLQEPQHEISRLGAEIDASLAAKQSVLVLTDRDVITGRNADESLRLSREVSLHISAIVASLSETPTFIVAKGGITSADIASKGLGLRRGYVLGQIAPGVPVWRIDEADHFRHVPYIVFPGNVGTDETLLTVYRTLSDE